ncbi:MAG: hydantoinase/oxoprolinase family protein [Alphaproteobacteria bacterium]
MASKLKTVGVDVGGTFTDLILLDRDSGAIHVAKVPTTTDNQAVGVLAALAETGVPLGEIETIIHGTTITTNALLERKFATAGLITTQGFRDVLELGRRTRPNPYGLKGWFEPLIPRERRFEVPERCDANGDVLTPLDEDAVRDAAVKLAAMGCESLVIHFLHAYVAPEHERRAAEIAAEVWPNGCITMGHAILSEYREYERGVTAAVNACIQPVLGRYITRLREGLAARGYEHDLLVMQGNGGMVSSALVEEAAVNTVMSGPASGVMAAAYTAQAAGIPHIITYDMGGTSCDVGVIRDGVPEVSSELELEYAMPIHVPMVDVHSIGAGGGSIASINDAGMLQVGPESAGADPGPICYGRGGRMPTVTDANLLLGRLNPKSLLAVDKPVPLDQVAAIFEETIGRPLGLDATAAAAATLRIANDRMAGALRLVSLERGHDPRDFSLFAFGGAGPLHASALAKELGIPQVLTPARPGITNALGCLVADLRHDYVNTVNAPVSDLDMDRLRAILEGHIAEGRATIKREGVAVTGVKLLHFADMQFLGQSHILTVPIALDITREDLQAAFEAAYWRRFEVELPEIRAVLVNLHSAVIGEREATPLEAVAHKPDKTAPRNETRRVWFGDEWIETPILPRAHFSAGTAMDGPAIIEQLDTTLVVEPGDHVVADSLGNLIITVAGAAP